LKHLPALSFNLRFSAAMTANLERTKTALTGGNDHGNLDCNMRTPVGLFVTGNDTGVGKTHVSAMIARAICAQGLRVGVYKPAASGCREESGKLVSDDATILWNAAGSPGELEYVCPQRFVAPLSPHLAARAEGKELDAMLLRQGLEYWRARSDFLLIEGAGGLMSPLGDEEYVADLARDLRYPLLVVAQNQIGVINQTLQTMIVAMTFQDGLNIAGVVLNCPTPAGNDPSLPTNRDQLAMRSVPPVLAEVKFRQMEFDPPVDWRALASMA
jgi:dethiobiotin synthetase